MKHLISYILVILVLSSCTGNKEEREKLKNAYELQQSAIQLIAEIEEELKTLESLKADSISNVIAELEETIFAIPGYELDLPGHEGHDHGHDHDHDLKVELTADQILAVQQELLEKLRDIQSLINNE